MKLPWDKNKKIEELEEEKNRLQDEVEELEEEKESYRKRFEAEKDRRSKLSTQKQEAEQKINKLKQKLDNSAETETEEEKKEETKIQRISLEKAKRILDKIESINSPEEDLATVYSPRRVKELGDQQGLKSSISKENYSFISDDSGFVAFLDDDFLGVKLKARPFFKPEWERANSFDTSKISSFIAERKKWAAVSAGQTVIFEEEEGEILGREEVSSRVDSKQKKGGFSQGRFERKRQEQVDEHLRMVEEKIDEDTLLVGEESLCKKLPGKYLGGFNSDRGSVDALYNFRLVLK